MLYAPPVDRLPAMEMVRSIAATWDERAAELIANEDRFDVMKRPFDQLEVGQTVYEFRSRVMGTFVPGRSGADGEFTVPEFFPEYVGRGRNDEAAFRDWRDQIHARFQELYPKRPFEMTEPEKTAWACLERQIDVAAYRLRTPLTVRQKGKVLRARPFPDRIEWEDGLSEEVKLDQMPGDFVTYKPGQPFEAIVARDPVDFRLLKVTYVQRAHARPRISSDEVCGLINSIPTSRSLPDADWD
jgi:hypothetical protein